MGRWITKNGVHVWLEDTSVEDSLVDALAMHYGKVKLPTLHFETREYAHVISEINTWYTKDCKSKRIISKAIGDFIYTFENKGYNNYRFIGVDNIEEMLDFIDEELMTYGKRK